MHVSTQHSTVAVETEPIRIGGSRRTDGVRLKSMAGGRIEFRQSTVGQSQRRRRRRNLNGGIIFIYCGHVVVDDASVSRP